ncbi:hypothetical protein BH24GEM3_BH24GEM3_12030 [soil metagenome]
MRLDRTSLYGALCVLASALACAPPQEDPATAPPDSRPALARGDTIPVGLAAQLPPLPAGWRALRCPFPDRQPRSFTARAGRVERVGPDFALLEIPVGALDREVRFTFTPLDTILAVEIQADTRGLTFDRPVDLTMSFATCRGNVPAPNQTLTIWRYREPEGWQNLGGNINGRVIRVQITKISRFTIAEGRI